jgi:hypothetical protein
MTKEQLMADYRCFGRCGRKFNELKDMIAVAGRGNRSPRHFCPVCARSLPHSPEEAYQ